MTIRYRLGWVSVAVGLVFAAVSPPGLKGQAAAPFELISVTRAGTAGGGEVFDDYSLYGQGPSTMTADDRFVVFASGSSDMVAGDSNGFQDVFVRDRLTGTATLVSRASDGSQANGPSGLASISANGRYVAFVSAATNLVPGDTNQAVDPGSGQPVLSSGSDVFVRDLQANTTVRVSVSSTGAQAVYGVNPIAPAISADGRYVAFTSWSNNLVADDTNAGNADVFVHDMLLGTTERVSLRSDGSEIVGSDSMIPSMSADGRRIAFVVYDNTLTGPTPQVRPNLQQGVYVRDLNTNQTILVSARTDGTPATYLIQTDPMISANGRFVSFSSWEDLDPAFPDADQEFDGPYADVFVRDLQTSTTRRASLPFPGGPPEESGRSATISGDGRFVVYGDRVRDMALNTTTLMRASDGSTPDYAPFFPSISVDGRYVSFDSYASGLVANDTNGVNDVFLFAVPPPKGADLSVTLTSTTLQPAVDTNVTLTAAVDNAGPDAATGVAVRLALPAGIAFVSATGAGSYDSATGVWTIPSIASGSTATRQIVGHVTSGLPVDLTAEVIASSEPDPDSTPGNNNPAEDDQKTIHLTPSVADLSLSLNANTPQPPVSSNVTLTVSLSNAGPAGATGVAARISLPATLTFVSASPAAAFDAATGVWTAGAIANGVTRTLLVVARVASPTPVDVDAQVTAANEPDPDSTPNNNVAGEDDQASVHLAPIVTGIIVNDATGVVNPNDGKCTLVEAIIAANRDAPSGNAIGECAGGNGPDVIHLRALTPPYSFTAVHNNTNGANGLPPITTDITIDAGGAAIERSVLPGVPAFRLFYVDTVGRLTLDHAVVRNGRATSVSPNGVEYTGGGILNAGSLDINGGGVSANSASCDGGGIETLGPLVVRGGAIISSNMAGCSGGGVSAFYAGSVTVADAFIVSNSAPAGGGGGLYVHGTTTGTVTNSSIDGNVARSEGGGVFTHNADANLTITDSLIRNNTVTAGHGGGISNGRLQTDDTGTVLVPGGTMRLTNTTVSGNGTIPGFGGGIANAGTVIVTGGTISNNGLLGAPGGFRCGGGVYSVGPLTMSGTAIGLNNAANGNGGGVCAIASAATITGGSITANAANVGGGVWATRSPSVVLTGVTVRANTAKSSAGGIESNVNGNLLLDGVVVQENTSAGDTGGILVLGGAVELRNNTRVVGNIATSLGGGITLASGPCCPTTFTMTGGLVDGNTANGDWSTFGGGGGIANVDVNPASRATLDGVVVSNNHAPIGDGGGIFNRGTLTMTGGELRANTAESGGALANGTSLMSYGRATLTNVAIAGNVAASLGGAIFTATTVGTTANGFTTVNGGSIQDNHAVSGGGIFSRLTGAVNVGTGTVISGNSATGTGGAIDSAGPLTMNGVTISGNAANQGGGLHSTGQSTIDASTVSGNTAVIGGGIRVISGLTRVTSSTLSGNVATGAGAGAIDVSGTAVGPGAFDGAVDVRWTTIAANIGTPGGIQNGSSATVSTTILAGNRRPDGVAAECAWSPTPAVGAVYFYSGDLVGKDGVCAIALTDAGVSQRVVDPARVFDAVLAPLANNGGPTATHALLPGSLAMDGLPGIAPCPADQRGEARPADGDGDGTAVCDVGSFEQQTPLASPAPAIAVLTPSSVATGAGGAAGQVIFVDGTGFVAGSVASWNGSPRQTFSASPTRISITLLPADLATAADIVTGFITVSNPGTGASNALPLTIVSSRVARVQTQSALPGGTVTVSTAPIGIGQSGVTATLTNNGAATGAATISVATYAVNPAGGTIFAAGGFFDVQVTGADPSDSVAARLYYPSTIAGAAEAALQLQYWTGATWAPVVSSGGAAPAKDTTNNLDGTISGGRFAVTFDGASTPSITALGGTVFAIAAGDATPPATRAAQTPPANANGWNNTDVTVKLVASDEGGVVARTEYQLDGGAWQPYHGAIRISAEGIHTLKYRSTDGAGNVEKTQTLTVRIDKTAPTVMVKVDPSVLWPPNHKLVDVTATVAVRDSLSGADGFTLISIDSDERCDRGHDDPDDIVGWRVGTDDTRGKLRAEKSDHGAERVYSLVYRGKDKAGNDAIGRAYVRVRRP